MPETTATGVTFSSSSCTHSLFWKTGFLSGVNTNNRGTNNVLMDQIAALHWIQENIAEFGGDASNVTITGHGYGAACVNILMHTDLGRGLSLSLSPLSLLHPPSSPSLSPVTGDPFRLLAFLIPFAARLLPPAVYPLLRMSVRATASTISLK